MFLVPYAYFSKGFFDTQKRIALHVLDSYPFNFYKVSSAFSAPEYISAREEVREMMHQSLLKLPGLRPDRYGNINVAGNSEEGLRHKYSFVLRQPFSALAGVRLDELLEWMRWGSEDGVMWELNAHELFRVIAWWERANPNAPPALYGVEGDLPKMMEWREFWRAHNAIAYMATPMTRCECGRVFDNNATLFCPSCDEHYLYGRQEPRHIVRGMGHYNLAIKGACGAEVAELAYATRGQVRPVPVDLPIICFS